MKVSCYPTRSLLPYLRDLGITSLYSSPLFKARRGSLHGYSVTNPLELNPELGSKAAFDHLAREFVRNRFLITRNMRDNLTLMILLDNPGTCSLNSSRRFKVSLFG